MTIRLDNKVQSCPKKHLVCLAEYADGEIQFGKATWVLAAPK